MWRSLPNFLTEREAGNLKQDYRAASTFAQEAVFPVSQKTKLMKSGTDRVARGLVFSPLPESGRADSTIPQYLVGWSGPLEHFVEGWQVLAVSKEAGVQIEISTVWPGRAENLPQHAFGIMDWHSVFPTVCFNRA